MKQYFGNYLGLVVNTEDPEKRGRVQVFIPGMMPTLYGGWDQTKKNISFKTFESETFSADLNFRLKSLLPWAEAAVPFWGGSTGAPINESTGAPTPMPTDQGFNYIYPEEGAGGGGISQQHYGDRKGDLGLELQGVIARGLAGTGLNWVSTSGTGFTERQADGSLHLSGKATDGHFTESVYPYRKLDPTTSEEDKGRIAYALAKLTQAGIGGIGYGPGYMGGTIKFHLDIGPYGNWGRDFTYKTQTPWVVNARSGNPQNPPRSNEPPPEAYADTRIADTSGLARSDGDPNGEYIKVGNGLSESALSSINRSLGIGSAQLANNAAVAYNTAYNESIARGATPQQASIVAAAIVGNIKQESNFNPNTIHDGGRGYGLLGEQGPHLTRLINYAATKGENRSTGISVQTQIEALFRDPDFLNGRPSSSGFPAWNGLSTLFNAGSVEEAARLFSGQTLNPTTGWGYLRPGNPRLENRIANATNANQAFSSIGAGELVAAVEGQNVLRTRVPDQYGSIDGNRTGAPMGFTSIPFVGSKVWVFFNGGDIQRPVYFAATYETENIV